MNNRTIVARILLLVGAALLAIGCASGRPPNAIVETRPTAFDEQPDGEARQITSVATKTTQLQDLRPDAPGEIFRGVHAKSHGCVNAKLTINESLDERYQVGLFREPGRAFDAKIRFSNAAVLRVHDLNGGSNGSRGMAVKVLDVGGSFLSTDDGSYNQDFLMINTTRFAFPTVRAYGFLTDTLLASEEGADPKKLFDLIGFMGGPTADPITEEHLADMQAAASAKGAPVPAGFSVEDLAAVNETFKVVGEIRRRTVRNPAQVQYFGAAPFLFGAKRVMKFSAKPCVDVEQAPFPGVQPGVTPTDPSKHYLRDALIESMKGDQEICYDFQIQVRNLGEVSTRDIEDASTEWPGERDNYVDVARITVPLGQNIMDPAALKSCEQLVFTPWHSLEAHQPVGGINRLRRPVYFRSSEHR